MEYRRLAPVRFAAAADRDSSEAKYWRRFSTARVDHLIGVGGAIHFSPAAPHDFAVTNGARVSLYSARTNRSRHALSRFGAHAYGGCYRMGDGALLVAGDGNGRVKVFDVKRRNLLRDFKGHGAAARAVAWAGRTAVVSGSDDGSVRRWSLVAQEETDKRDASGDHVRAVACPEASGGDPNLVVTGAYDHQMRVWDWRMPNAVASWNCKAPVEAVMLAPGGGLVYAAAGNTVQVWDLLGSFKKVHEFSNHAKAITQITMDSAGSRLLTASLDGHVKVVNNATYEVMHSMRFPAGVIGLAVAPDNLKLVAALEDGSLVVRKRANPNATTTLKEKRRVDRLKGGTYSFFTRGKNALPSMGDVVASVGEKQRLKPYDKALQRFRYMEGLDLALATKNAVTIVSVLRELKMRRGLETAIGGRTDEALEPLLSFLVTNVTQPRYAPLLLEVTHIVLDIYAAEVGASMLVDELLKRLQQVVRSEVRSQEKGLALLGAIEAISTAARAVA